MFKRMLKAPRCFREIAVTNSQLPRLILVAFSLIEEGNKRMKTPILILSTIALSGCVAVWGSSYNIAMSNSRSVVIEYDRVIANMPAMLNAAQAECNKYGKDAVLDNVSGGNLGIRVNTYRCETREADTVIDVQG